MKPFYLFFVSLFFVGHCLYGQVKVPSADEILQPVYAKAAKENKKVLVIFHASWCGWCRKMDSSLYDAAVQPLINKEYEIAHLTVHESPEKIALENKGALALLAKYKGDEKGLPYWFVFDKDGNLLANSEAKPNGNVGCPATEEEVAYFINVLKKTSSLKDNELELIKKRFRKNE